jgi:DNA gyrase subunit A
VNGDASDGAVAETDAVPDGRGSVARAIDLDRVHLEHRLHVVEGMCRALASLPAIDAALYDAPDAAAAMTTLTSAPFDFSEVQARYVLDMPLRRLTTAERAKLEAEATDLRARIGH